jgi:hypothetical protein
VTCIPVSPVCVRSYTAGEELRNKGTLFISAQTNHQKTQSLLHEPTMKVIFVIALVCFAAAVLASKQDVNKKVINCEESQLASDVSCSLLFLVGRLYPSLR